MTEPTPVDDPQPLVVPRPGGATRAPLAEGEEPEATPLARAKSAYDLVSDVLTPKTIGLLVAVVALVVAGLLGGWDKVESVEKVVPKVAVGVSTAVGPFDVAIQRAYAATSLPPTLPKVNGTRFLIVIADVRTSGTEPQYASLLKDVLAVDTPGIKAHGPATYRLTDGQPAGRLQPGLTYQVVCVWEQQASSPAPTDAHLTFSKLTWRQSFNDGSFYWLDPEPVGVVAVGVRTVEGS